MATTKPDWITIPDREQIERCCDGYRLYGRVMLGGWMFVRTAGAVPNGYEPIDVILTYTDPPEIIHGHCLPNQTKEPDLP